jgi:membrane protein implicated in regulation of membrane protease activity
MSWAAFYLVCFVVGFAFSTLLFLSGGVHFQLPLRWHFPHVGLHHPAPPMQVGHGAGIPHAAGTGAAHAPQAPGSAPSAHPVSNPGPGISPFNFLTLTAFLAWFGGTGYLLTVYSGVWFAMTLVFSLLAGLAGAGLVFWFLARLMASEKPLDPADFAMIGVLGRISSPIREGGTGEIIYSQAGTRRTCGARADDGKAVAKGAEVVVTRFELGLAYVRRWEEMAPEFSSPAEGAAAAGAEPPEKSS